MGFLDIDLNDVQEPTTIDADSEVKVRIVGTTEGTDKNNHPYLLARFDVPEEPTCKDFTKFYSLPHGEMEPKKLNNAKWALKVFFDAFDIDPSGGIDLEELPGKTAWVILGVSSDDQYGDQNYIKKFIKSA